MSASIKMTTAQFTSHRSNGDGLCFGCMAIVVGGVHADAVNEPCGPCGGHNVQPFQEALLANRVQLTD